MRDGKIALFGKTHDLSTDARLFKLSPRRRRASVFPRGQSCGWNCGSRRPAERTRRDGISAGSLTGEGFMNINLVRAGEILGLAGLVGAGRAHRGG